MHKIRKETLKTSYENKFVSEKNRRMKKYMWLFEFTNGYLLTAKCHQYSGKMEKLGYETRSTDSKLFEVSIYYFGKNVSYMFHPKEADVPCLSFQTSELIEEILKQIGPPEKIIK